MEIGCNLQQTAQQGAQVPTAGEHGTKRKMPEGGNEEASTF